MANRRERTRERHLRTEDGGERWQRLSGGLPTGKIGRIGLDIYQKNPAVLYALIENQNPNGRRGGHRGECNPATRCRNHRQRAVPHGRWRRTWQRTSRRQRRRRQGTLFVQSDSHQSSRRPDGHRQQRLDVHLARCRKDMGLRILSRGVRRLPIDVVGPRRSRAHHPRQRRRRQRVGRRGPHGGLLPEHGHRRGVRARRGHGRSLQRLRRLPGSRLMEGPEQQSDRADHARALGHGRPR